MTFIAFACKGDHADIATDSAAYLANGAKFGRSTKILTINHLDAAVLTQGDGLFSSEAKAALLLVSNQLAASFDELADQAPDLLRTVWDGLDDGSNRYNSTVYLVGYSPRRGAFDAYGFASEHGFEPWRITGLHATPSRFSQQPNALDLERALAEGWLSAEDAEAWGAMPAAAVPAEATDWAMLAIETRAQRSLTRAGKVFVAGDLYLTKLDRGSVSTFKAWEFDDSGDEFRQMVQGTDHPLVQLGPCPCESGRRAIDCCTPKAAGVPCACWSGKTFGDCCMVDSLDPAKAAAAR